MSASVAASVSKREVIAGRVDRDMAIVFGMGCEDEIEAEIMNSPLPKLIASCNWILIEAGLFCADDLAENVLNRYVTNSIKSMHSC